MQRTDRVRNLAALSHFRVGAWLVQPDRLILAQDGREIDLEPRQMEVLVSLAEHAGEVVSAEQLLIEVWRGTFYGDNPVHKAIAQLRKLIGDDSRTPRYIETIRKRGYRLIAAVSYPDDYRRSAVGDSAWSGRSPYVGLASFDDAHADVFFGRSRMTAELLAAMRSQIDSQRRFVLLVGASGCGKTSLLRAGAIPLLRQDGGFDGLQSLSMSTCDFSGVDAGEVLPRMAAALCEWQLGDRPVFASPDAIVDGDARSAERIADTLRDAFHKLGSREIDANPHAHLLLIVDHAEALVASPNIDQAERDAFARLLTALCDSPRTLVAMVSRSDFYPKLIEAVPDLAERKSGDGHLDVLTPRPGEIAQIIRTPALLAGLSFEEDRHTLSRLDDVLRDAAAQHPDALPLLQHTLQALYERRSDSGELGFEAYRDIGGLEGALAHRAEQVFAALPDAARRQLDTVLAQLIVIQPDSDAVSGRRVLWSALDNDDARALAEAFVRARLFVGELRDGCPGFGVAHEALLRQWPRARDWAQDNRRLLHARARLQRATARWVEEGRGSDHLLNAGRPLSEAMDAARTSPEDLSADERSFLQASQRLQSRKRWLRASAVAGLALLAAISTVFALLAVRARNEAERRREEALQLSDFMLVDLADKLRPLGNLKLLDSISAKALSQLDGRSESDLDTDDLTNRARAMRTAGEVMMEEARLNEAETAFRRADAAARAAVLRTPDSVNAIKESGITAYWLGYVYYRQTRLDQAKQHWSDYLAASERAARLAPKDIDARIEVSYALNNLGTVANDLGRHDEAIGYFQRSAALKKSALETRRDDANLRYDLIDTLSWISTGEENRGRLAIAAAGYGEQIAMLRDLLAKRPEARAWDRRLATSLRRHGHLLIALGRLDEAAGMLDESVSRLQRLTSIEPDNVVWRRDYAHTLLERGELLRQRGAADAARADFARTRALSAQLVARPDAQAEWRRLDAIVRARLGALDGDRSAEDAAIGILESLAAKSADDINTRRAFGLALMLRAARDRRDRAADEGRTDFARLRALLTDTAPGSRDPQTLALWIAALRLSGASSPAPADLARLDASGYRAPDYLAWRALADDGRHK